MEEHVYGDGALPIVIRLVGANATRCTLFEKIISHREAILKILDWLQQSTDCSDDSITMDVVNRVLSEPPSPAKPKRNSEIINATPEEVALLREEFEKRSKLGYSVTKDWIESTIVAGVFEHAGTNRLLPLANQAAIAACLAELAKKENKLRASRIWSRSCLLLWPGEGKFWSLASKLGAVSRTIM